MMQHTHHRRRFRRAAAAATAVALGAGAISASAAAASAAPPEPVIHYTMDDVGDGVVPDSSGNGLDGSISGATENVDAPDGPALGLTGGHVTIPAGALEDAADLTVSTRVKWDGTGGAWQWLFALGQNTDRYLFATPSNGDGNLRAAVTQAAAGGEATVTGEGPLHTDEWATLTVTLDDDADTVTTYLNGVPVGSAASDVAAADLWGDGAESTGFIGKSFYPDPAFAGAVDDFRLYDAALTPEQVADLVPGDVPTRETVTDRIDVDTVTGAAPELPATVLADYSDGYQRGVPVVWEDVAPEQYASSGEFTVTGDADGTEVAAVVTVRGNDVSIDLGATTGPVHGGASGVLYGLYGEGMPTDNLIEGMDVRSVATKAQDGSQHPGSDALEILPTLSETTGGDVYLRVTDWYRGFPYQWPGDTPQEKLADYREVLDAQLEMIEQIPAEQRENLVIEPFNEPEGNMFGTGQWSLDGTSWLDDPADYFAAWDSTYRRIKEAFPDMRVAGPGTSILFDQNKGFMEHAVAEGTVPDIVTWHELTHPQAIRDSVAKYRGWEAAAFAGTEYEGTELPLNINEYAFNYHTSVPGQMIQWISAIEDTKVDAMIAFWNINGNLSDSAVQVNRGNGQWWLYNAYSKLSGETVEVAPPFPGQNYSLQGVASLDEDKRTARAILGGADGKAPVTFENISAGTFGDTVRVWVHEIGWTGQLGDSAQPAELAELVLPVEDGRVTVDFDGETLPQLSEASAYELVMTPAGAGAESTVDSTWSASYEAEDADYTGGGYSRNGPEGSPADVGKFYTSGGFNVGGLRTGSDGALDFTVEVPQDGEYDLSVFANSLNTYPLIEEQGPTNVFLRVDGEAEQELFLPLGYKWVVWDHTDTTVELTAGTHTITLAAQSLDGSGATVGDALIDRITLSQPRESGDVYEAETAVHDGGFAEHDKPDDGSGSGGAKLADGQSATFWVYGEHDGEAQLALEAFGSGAGTLSVNDREVAQVGRGVELSAHLQGGVNKIVVTAQGRKGLKVDRLVVDASAGQLAAVEYQAEDAEAAGEARTTALSLAEGGTAVEGIGGEPGNANTLTFEVEAQTAGEHAVVVRYSNPEQVPATHYNPNPMARHADFSVNGGDAQRVLFAPSFHANNFFERTIYLELEEGANTVTVSAEEEPNFDGETYAEQNWPGIPLRAAEAPIIDRITVSPLRD